MKKLLIVVLCVLGFQAQAQTSQELLNHYREYYKQMKIQGDSQGIINGLTHLILLSPSEAQAHKDTLAMVYMSEGNHVQALNTIGIDTSPTDSDIAIEVKAVSLKALNEPNRALIHFEELFKRTPDPSIAYELAELYLQTNNLTKSNTYIEYGLTNSKENMGKTFYESQQPYQVPLKAAFLYLKGLSKYNENKATNIDAAVAILDEALKIAPNFNLVQISKNALMNQKKEAKPKE
ncbi:MULTISPECIES: tetratricopeptide repeat protein [Bizionia]|uniref:Tetratricopeptide repeat protein n=1 Tax=Bizionia algoritergicola TaxID=291187 RepID=A0A5D0R1F3_9FLAO|nr:MULTISPECIES: hypothetical protein [Bizionia]OBX24395.1 hypothetical protein BAA08_00955 [Bizionia sp. APA-3]TYB75317.1 hypothetical protein ES675_04095 [Bizionia algoritergicola]